MRRATDDTARLVFGRVELQAADAVILTSLAAFSLLAVGGRATVEGWPLLVARNVCVSAAVLISAAVTPRIRRLPLAFLLRTATVTFSFAYLFSAVAGLQLILHESFRDDLVLAFEARLFGVQPTLWMERFITPALTEWMMFCYVIYLPLYPVLCAILWVKRGEAAAEEYFFTLGLANVLCDAGFILFPVAGPMYWMPDRYSVPLHGWVFTWAGELIRTRAHFAGGSLPSPHAAAATVMWLMAWRHYRPAFWALAPVILSLYVSTFYCRYHYVTDTILGIATAGLALIVAPLLQRAWNRLAGA
ncbi:MAG: phosphatase PAP2 family protein [Thermoanaerobaculia bacterium]|nr:phosphatase PAP2 family protein [Thermoanaerobaculia bacterium]